MTVRGDLWDVGVASAPHFRALGSKGRRVLSQIFLSTILGYYVDGHSLMLVTSWGL